jgi:lipopolysaccharide export system permease protein
MRTLHGYLLRQVSAALLLTVATATLVLVMGNMLLKEILELLVNRQAAFGVVLHALLLLIPFVTVYSLPVGMLTATLLVFGRFSADQELTAARASGVSLLSLVTPVLGLAVVLCGLSAWFNLQLAPQCRVAYKRLLYRLGVEQPPALLAPNQFIRRFPGYVIYVGGVESNRLENLVLYRMDTNPPPAPATLPDAPPAAAPTASRVELIITAKEALLRVDPTNEVIQLEMPRAEVVSVRSMQLATVSDSVLELPFRIRRIEHSKPKISNMTLSQLLEEYRRNQADGIRPLPVILQLHKEVAFSLACLGFTLVGIPLGIRAHRRETSIGIALAIGLMLVYYVFYILAEAWQNEPRYHPHLLVWLPNFLFQGVGAWLLWRANRRG